MSWQQAHRYYRTLQDVELVLDGDPSGTVPWRAEWAELFGGPAGLRLALATRWRRLVEAQGDTVPVAELAGTHPGLARLIGLRAAELVAS